MAQSNYDRTKEQMQAAFLKYDPERMIRQFHLSGDERRLYVFFVGRLYSVDRQTGAVERQAEGFSKAVPADFNEAMTIYDVLCCARENCRLSGRYAGINNMKGILQASRVGEGSFQSDAQFFDGKEASLAAACEELGGEKQTVGDVSYKLPLFDFLPVMLQFWASDEEFPPCLKLMWDENILDYMHYETTWYAASHLISRLKELVSRFEQQQKTEGTLRK